MRVAFEFFKQLVVSVMANIRVTLFYFCPLGIGLNPELSYFSPAGPYASVRMAGNGVRCSCLRLYG